MSEPEPDPALDAFLASPVLREWSAAITQAETERVLAESQREATVQERRAALLAELAALNAPEPEPPAPNPWAGRRHIACSCGCYHPILRDVKDRVEIRFACPHPVHHFEEFRLTYTNPPNDAAIVGEPCEY